MVVVLVYAMLYVHGIQPDAQGIPALPLAQPHRWKDYPTCVNWTWEPESNITHAPEAIKDFHTKNPLAPHRLPLNTRTILFQRIPNDNIPIHIPHRLCSSTGGIFNWEDGVFKQHNGDQDTHPKMGVML